MRMWLLGDGPVLLYSVFVHHVEIELNQKPHCADIDTSSPLDGFYYRPWMCPQAGCAHTDHSLHYVLSFRQKRTGAISASLRTKSRGRTKDAPENNIGEWMGEEMGWGTANMAIEEKGDRQWRHCLHRRQHSRAQAIWTQRRARQWDNNAPREAGIVLP